MFKKRTIAVLLVCLLAISVVLLSGNKGQQQTQASTANVDTVNAPEIDVCMHLDSFRNSTAVVADMKELGVRWVRIDWIPNNATMDNFMQTMHANNISVLAIIDSNTVGDQNFKSSDWNIDVTVIMQSQYAKYVGAWEIWNEPNSPTYPYAWFSPQDYCHMLQNASSIIRNYTNASIVAAGLSPVGNWTINNLYNAYPDTGNCIDYQGVHIYSDVKSNLANIATAQSISNKPIWVTEYGCPSAPTNESYTEQGQTAWIQTNFAMLQAHAQKTFWYELYDEVAQVSAKENSFGLLMINENRKLSFNILSAVSYLTGHFDKSLGLIYESEDSGIKVILNETTYHYNQTYNIYSDNLIAEWALKPWAPQISDKINQTIQSYNLPNPNFWEVMFRINISQVLYNGIISKIEQFPNYVILAEIHNSSTPLTDKNADTLIYQSLNCWIASNETEARHYFQEAHNMSDGRGIFDSVINLTAHDAHYDNYKLALILYASRVLDITIGDYSQIEAKLWSMQKANGGITSWANLNGDPDGSANAETTSMALLLYNTELIQIMATSTPSTTPLSSPSSSPANSLAATNSLPQTTIPSPTPTATPEFPILTFGIALAIILLSTTLLAFSLKRANLNKL